jgi:hypothetical protein
MNELHPDDAPPTQVGQEVESEEFIVFGIGPDGKFFINMAPDDNEERAWNLITLGLQAVEQYYGKKRPLIRGASTSLRRKLRGMR